MRWSCSLIALAILTACASTGVVTPGPAGPPTAPGESPFEIRLTMSPVPSLRGLIVNRTRAEQPLLYDVRTQPSRLALFQLPGLRKMPATDSRAVEKFDNTVYAGNFEKLPPGGSKLIEDQRLVKGDDGNYMLRWGPYLFANLTPGDYRAQVIFDHEIDTYQEGGSKRTMPGVWKGTVRSNELVLHLR